MELMKKKKFKTHTVKLFPNKVRKKFPLGVLKRQGTKTSCNALVIPKFITKQPKVDKPIRNPDKLVGHPKIGKIPRRVINLQFFLLGISIRFR